MNSLQWNRSPVPAGQHDRTAQVLPDLPRQLGGQVLGKPFRNPFPERL
jgi:hypothetical protein